MFNLQESAGMSGSMEERREAITELKQEGHSNRESGNILGNAEGTVRNDLKGAQNCAP